MSRKIKYKNGKLVPIDGYFEIDAVVSWEMESDPLVLVVKHYEFPYPDIYDEEDYEGAVIFLDGFMTVNLRNIGGRYVGWRYSPGTTWNHLEYWVMQNQFCYDRAVETLGPERVLEKKEYYND